MVGERGIEPPISYERGILSPLHIPVLPLPRIWRLGDRAPPLSLIRPIFTLTIANFFSSQPTFVYGIVWWVMTPTWPFVALWIRTTPQPVAFRRLACIDGRVSIYTELLKSVSPFAWFSRSRLDLRANLIRWVYDFWSGEALRNERKKVP